MVTKVTAVLCSKTGKVLTETQVERYTAVIIRLDTRLSPNTRVFVFARFETPDVQDRLVYHEATHEYLNPAGI